MDTLPFFFFSYRNNLSPCSRCCLCCLSQFCFVQSFCRSHDLTQYVWIASLGYLLQMLLFGALWGRGRKAGSGREGEISSRHPYKQLLALLCFPASCSGRMYPNFALLVLPEPSPVDFNSGTCGQSFLSLMHPKGDASAKCLTRIACT